MQLSIIGSGNMAFVLGKKWQETGIAIKSVYSRNKTTGKELSTLLSADFLEELPEKFIEGDMVCIAVSDSALPGVIASINYQPETLFFHLGGAVSKELLSNCSNEYGVLWPMKMIRKGMPSLQPVSVFIDANNQTALSKLEFLANALSDKVSVANDEQRSKMHMVAAIVSNFTNHLLHLAADYCKDESIDFEVFYPIIQQMAEAVTKQHPSVTQSGPAFRRDMATITKHQLILKEKPSLLKVYQTLTDSIIATSYIL